MKKRLVTTAILTLVISLFFCTSVFADNIVIQGESDTVTAAYGSNDVTIALRARKLRVINTGTAAAGYAGYTPVIVSITIYNLGNQNCLVNNLKFRLTSESAEYRIAGFENISSDLFISDTAYDATGYLSIKASNDYTYAGGFVVPANSNMTYVGIINVSANWITENQTWRTVDLSTATFYDNLTTTIGDYPCAAIPVDLSSIESDIDSMLTVLQGMDLDSSTYLPLLRDILNTLSYTGSNYTQSNTGYTRTTLQESIGNTGVTCQVYRYQLPSYYITDDIEINSSSDTIINSGTVCTPVYYWVRIYNPNNSTLVTYPSWTINNAFPAASSSIVQYFRSQNFDDIHGISNVDLYFSNSDANGYVSKGTYVTTFVINIYHQPDEIVTFNDMSLTYYRAVMNSNIYRPANEYYILRDLYLAMNPNSVSNDPDEVNTESQSINTAVESIQTAEAQYFADNQEAIENTGLSNFHFNDNQVWSLTMIVDQFETVWNALGEFTVVYIFTLMMSLATYLIRHEPTTKVKQWRESVSVERAERTSYYGRKNAEARAHDSTMKKAIRRR